MPQFLIHKDLEIMYRFRRVGFSVICSEQKITNSFTQDYVACKWWIQELNPRSLALESMILTTHTTLPLTNIIAIITTVIVITIITTVTCQALR